jgi:hypothetical protein
MRCAEVSVHASLAGACVLRLLVPHVPQWWAPLVVAEAVVMMFLVWTGWFADVLVADGKARRLQKPNGTGYLLFAAHTGWVLLLACEQRHAHPQYVDVQFVAALVVDIAILFVRATWSFATSVRGVGPARINV